MIVSGILFWYPLAGVTYQFLHYLVGLRRLGYDVHYVEDSGRWVYDPRINDRSPDASSNVAVVARALDAHGFTGRWAFRGNYPDGRCYGMESAQIDRLYREADVFLNVTAAQELRDEILRIPRRLYVESDPFPAQVMAEQGDPFTLEMLRGHDTLFTFGENIGQPDCSLPLAGFTWLPTRQPVVLSLWDNPLPRERADAPFTTITTWHNEGKDLEFNGQQYYWTKDREFLKFIDLPRRRGVPFELAAGIDEETEALLRRNGWRLRGSVGVSHDITQYQAYLQRSRGEFTVARDQYVRPRTGWFSDRSACYLAAGRPVITQETGFSKFLPTGKGLFAFETMEDALAAVDSIESDYEGNCRGARDVAAEFFDADKVLGSLMDRAGL